MVLNELFPLISFVVVTFFALADGLQAVKGEPPAQAAKNSSSQAGAKQETAHHVPPRCGEQLLIEILETRPASTFTED